MVGGLYVVLFGPHMALGPIAESRAATTTEQRPPVATVYRENYLPPRPEEAPEAIRGAVMRGYEILTKTHAVLGASLEAKIDCADCHFQGGITDGGKNGGLSLVGVAAVYPRRRLGSDTPIDLAGRINGCVEHHLNAPPLLPQSQEMIDLVTYCQWISRGVPVYARVDWLKRKPLRADHSPDGEAGDRVFAERCAMCHGRDGAGTSIAPPLWGPHAFTAAGDMNRPGLLARFVYENMPRGAPILSPKEAIEVAALVTSKPRPE